MPLILYCYPMIRLRENDIVIGRPLPWPVFDRDRHLLLRPGHVVETEQQLAEIGKRGLFRAAGMGPPGQPYDGADEDVHDDNWRTWAFEDLKLPMGTRMSLRKLDPDDDGRYATTLLGILKDVSLIVGIPAPGGRLAMFRQGQPLLLRAFTGTRVFAFTASVLVVRYAPGAYIHIECPKTVDGTEVRARTRIKVRLIAVVTTGPDDSADVGRTTQVEDLSVGGARLIVAQPLGEASDELSLAFRLKAVSGEATLKLRAVIRTTVQLDDGRVAYGVQFVDVDPIILLALEGYVARMTESGGEEV